MLDRNNSRHLSGACKAATVKAIERWYFPVTLFTSKAAGWVVIYFLPLVAQQVPMQWVENLRVNVVETTTRFTLA